ncbi:uncharacterized protein LACBIDRAFT_330814 [Laccaria bicolor S238N-H82]|uniref:Predicted protein n=1 Tax=Laccaria bicolor (strain S238N-H82 / ATCC MYA-4686) TaxID=486041 RepID=B0DMK1_LACBS|nr:uncharacterized protein LACBIDRAFT_330814 [Laccaria bicolor S238N-H82]EDR04201.1 predicted protein [Laccaria bicolor S238N-H82]|eukprot:XP_001885092.1 predicted protein [Laccaria bicolor S238N-H82]
MESTPYTLIGTPFSTFTRTVAMGLRYKGLKYNQVSTPPSSPVAFEHHPFGFLPTLIIHEDQGKRVDVKLRESQAIVRFIDRIAPSPSLHIAPGEGGAVIEEKMWELVSLAACFGYPIVEVGVVKPRVKAMDEGKLSEEKIRQQLESGVVKLKEFLTLVESLMAPDGFAFGEHPSWADFFLFPLIADLRALHEWNVVGRRLNEWMGKMDELPAVKETTPGTLAVGARP